MMNDPAGKDALCFANFGSGSAGNASVVWWNGTDGEPQAILLDLGLGPRRVRDGLLSLGLAPSQVVAALLTHLDQDHFRRSWARSLEYREIPVFVQLRHAVEARSAGVPQHLMRVFEDEPEVAEGMRVSTALVAHDDSGSVAFRIERGEAGLGFATDLGRVPDSLIEFLAGCDLVALECNHCPRMQAASPRPAFLKARITGGRGHLSNEEAIAALAAIVAQGEPEHIVLLHLSRQCNCPKLVRRMFETALPGYADRLSITAQDRVTGPLVVARREGRAVAASGSLFASLDD